MKDNFEDLTMIHAQLTTENDNALYEMAWRVSRTEMIRRLIRCYADDTFEKVSRSRKQSSFNLNDKDLAILDEIAKRSNTSRSETVNLLIERAWKDYEPSAVGQDQKSCGVQTKHKL